LFHKGISEECLETFMADYIMHYFVCLQGPGGDVKRLNGEQQAESSLEEDGAA
jgi:hypothetical protein